MTHEERLTLIHEPLPATRVLSPSYPWGGVYVDDCFGEGHDAAHRAANRGRVTKFTIADDDITFFIEHGNYVSGSSFRVKEGRPAAPAAHRRYLDGRWSNSRKRKKAA